MRKPYQVRDVTQSTIKKNGACVHCGNVAMKEALFNGDGVTIIEKYCEDCMQTEKFTAIMAFYAMTEN